MRKIFLFIICCVFVIACSEDEEVETQVKTTNINISNTNYVFNLSEISADFVKTRLGLDEQFHNVTIEKTDDTVVLNANNSKHELSLFKSFKCIYHLKDSKVIIYNIAFTYSIENISDDDLTLVKAKLKETVIL